MEPFRIGERVRQKLTGNAYTVVEMVGNTPVVARHITIGNPDEWHRMDSLGRVVLSPEEQKRISDLRARY